MLSRATYSDAEREMFLKFGEQYETLMSNLSPLQLYNMTVGHAFVHNLTGPHVEALRRTTKAWMVDNTHHRHTPEFDALCNIENADDLFIRLSDELQVVLDSDEEWEVKYDIVFSDHYSKRIFVLGLPDYYDPDMGYEDDVRAFISAVKRKADRLKEQRNVDG